MYRHQQQPQDRYVETVIDGFRFVFDRVDRRLMSYLDGSGFSTISHVPSTEDWRKMARRIADQQ